MAEGRSVVRWRPAVTLAMATLALSGCLDESGSDGSDDLRASGDAQNTPPSISGSPPLNPVEGELFEYRVVASDPDGDALSFSVSSKPNWATFDTVTGGITGVPSTTDVGEVWEFSIFVSDGKASGGIGPFEISVQSKSSPAPSNTAPSINGVPPPSVIAGGTYVFRPSAADPDNDPLSFSVSNLPPWATFDVSTGQLSGVPDQSSVGIYRDIRIRVSDGRSSAALRAFSILVEAAPTPNSPPTISGNPAPTIATGSSYMFQPLANDADGDRLTFQISNRPSWAQFDESTGQLQGRPTGVHEGTYSNIRISVSDGKDQASLLPFSILVVAPEPENRPPVISGTPATGVEVGREYVFQPTASDADDDALIFNIANRPSWASFDATTGRLSGVPLEVHVGTFSGVRISVTDGESAATLPAFSVTVSEGNQPPEIDGTPKSVVAVGEAYEFQPIASDADDDTLRFSIDRLPIWANFDTTTGRLTGTPAESNIGTYNAITIRVTDGQASTDLPTFAIVVEKASDPNTAPTISGAPSATAKVGENYQFQPVAVDADNDPLTFSATNLPVWLRVDQSTGRLSGTPSASDIGMYDGLEIAVSDGVEQATIGPFSVEVVAASLGSVTIAWQAPTTRSDGSALTNLAGYRIYYGQDSRNYSQSVDLGSPGLSTYVISDLAAGTWYFAMKSRDANGIESEFSNETSVIIP